MRYPRLLVAATISLLALSIPAAHADSMTGQFSIQGTLIDTGSALDFSSAETGVGTQTGSFTTILTDNEAVSGNPTLTYSPAYVPDSEVFTVGSLTIDLKSFQEDSPGVFSGVALLSAAGFTDTDADVSLTTQLDKGPVTFSATTTVPSVPEPATFSLLGIGILGMATAVRRKFHAGPARP
jgi:hypothetical protein